MKKIIVAAIMLSLLLTGCQNPTGAAVSQTEPAKTTSALQEPVSYEPDDFEISARVVNGKFARGETIWIDVSITNKMDTAYTWFGSSTAVWAWAEFVCADNGKEFVIVNESPYMSEDECYWEFKPGETSTTTHEFVIPDNAVPGEYTLVCSFMNTTFEMKDGFILE